MNDHARKLLTIVTEMAVEKQVVADLERLGAELRADSPVDIFA